MHINKEVLKNLPGVDKLLQDKAIIKMIDTYNEALVKFAIRESLSHLRKNPPRQINDLLVISAVREKIDELTGNSFRPVINATGIIVYTNLGRAPFSDALINEASSQLRGYNNLEYNLEKGERGSRHDHLTAKLKYLTGAEDVILVNNNAAAVMLILRAFAKQKEVIISRGELIEIGGSFRIPEIMAASDCKMVEVGSTNKTYLNDYARTISPETGLLFKAHTSNYVIKGFTHEVALTELVSLGGKHKVPVVYDMGSGLLRKTSIPILKDEPDVRQTLKTGVDLVCFSGDKLIGGPQAGIIAGKAKYIKVLKKEPMMRALRIGKTTLAYMEAALKLYLDDEKLLKFNTIFQSLDQSPDQLLGKAEVLHKQLAQQGIPSQLVDSQGYCGGGALPGESIPSKAVKLDLTFNSGKERSAFSERVFHGLLAEKPPIISILKKGEIYLDVLTLGPEELNRTADTIARVIQKIN
jgi:L-seryl-tRNA(Ser) seleniumtransferase